MKTIVKRFDIVVNLVSEEGQLKLAASKAILPLHPDDRDLSKFDYDAVDAYLQFLNQFRDMLAASGMHVMKEYFSDNDISFSYYIQAYDSKQSTDADIKLMFFFRISDHSQSYQASQEQYDFFERKSNFTKQPPYKRYQRFKVRDVVINNKKYKDYDEALNALSTTVTEMRDKY